MAFSSVVEVPSTPGSLSLVPGKPAEVEGMLPSTEAVSIAPGVCKKVPRALSR